MSCSRGKREVLGAVCSTGRRHTRSSRARRGPRGPRQMLDRSLPPTLTPTGRPTSSCTPPVFRPAIAPRVAMPWADSVSANLLYIDSLTPRPPYSDSDSGLSLLRAQDLNRSRCTTQTSRRTTRTISARRPFVTVVHTTARWSASLLHPPHQSHPRHPASPLPRRSCHTRPLPLRRRRFPCTRPSDFAPCTRHM